MLTVQITLAKLGLTKLHLHPSGRGERSLKLRIGRVELVQGETLSGAANASAVGADRRFPEKYEGSRRGVTNSCLKC